MTITFGRSSGTHLQCVNGSRWNTVNEFEKYWGNGSYPPESIILSQRDFDALTERLNEKPDPKALESIRKLLDRRAPWDT
jgi:hypothetical protein